MAKQSVNVIVKARDEASRKFKRIGSSAVGMGNMIKKAAAMAAVYFGGRAIARFLTESATAFMKQEDALFTLATALKTAGEYSESTMKKFRDFAAQIQQTTIYGDEEVLALMQLEKSLGVSADNLEEATKQSIGLAAALGRDTNTMAQYIALAQQGEFTMLRRYIPALRKTTDATEQLKIVTKFAADGFKIAEAQAKTTSGAVKQMKNAWGDMKEMIGEALAPEIIKFSKIVKRWTEDNKKSIGDWAKTAIAYIHLIKDVIIDFVEYMRKDWVGGLKFAFDSFIEIIQATFKTAIRMAIVAGRAMWEAFFEGPPTEKQITAEMHAILRELGILREGGTYTGREYIEAMRKRGFTREAGYPAPPGLYAYAVQRLEERNVERLYGDTFKAIRKDFRKAFDDIAEKTPPALAVEVRESYDKFLARLLEIERGEFISWRVRLSEWLSEKIAGIWERPGMPRASTAVAAAVAKELRPLEARFLTFAPGTKFNKTEYNTGQTAKYTGQLTKLIPLMDKTAKILDRISRMKTQTIQEIFGITDFK